MMIRTIRCPFQSVPNNFRPFTDLIVRWSALPVYSNNSGLMFTGPVYTSLDVYHPQIMTMKKMTTAQICPVPMPHYVLSKAIQILPSGLCFGLFSIRYHSSQHPRKLLKIQMVQKCPKGLFLLGENSTPGGVIYPFWIGRTSYKLYFVL